MTLEDVDRSSLTLVPDSVVALFPLPVQSNLGIQYGKPLYVIRNLFYADICCGKGRIAKWFMLFGMKGMPIDIIYGPQFNLATLSGLALAIIVVLRIVDKGFIMCQPQCSWFVWVSRSVHQRTSATPYGDVNNPKNQEATKLNMAISILARIAFACGVLWLTEQPLSSVFFDTDEQKSVIDECEAKNSTLDLGPFGHRSQKPLKLVCTVPWLDSLKKTSEKLNKTEKVSKQKKKEKGETQGGEHASLAKG